MSFLKNLEEPSLIQEESLAHSKPTLTVFSDASVRPLIQRAGWGGWAKGDSNKGIYSSGSIPYYNDSSYAELYGILGMLKHIKDTNYHSLKENIVIQCDNLNALGWILFHASNSYPAKILHKADKRIVPISTTPDHSKRIVSGVVDILKDIPVVYLKHIKGHQSSKKSKNNPRAYINKKCDELARIATRIK